MEQSIPQKYKAGVVGAAADFRRATRYPPFVRMLTVDPGLRGCGCAFWERQPNGWRLVQAAHAAALPHDAEAGGDDGPVAWNAAVGAVELLAGEVWPNAEPEVIVVERMKVYTRGPGDPRDLLALMAVGGGLFRAFHAARPLAPLPAEYKGQVPRGVYGDRIEKRLREAAEGAPARWGEVRVPKQKTHLNDVMHAVGMGLCLIERGRV
jgi:hypothetical protein